MNSRCCSYSPACLRRQVILITDIINKRGMHTSKMSLFIHSLFMDNNGHDNDDFSFRVSLIACFKSVGVAGESWYKRQTLLAPAPGRTCCSCPTSPNKQDKPHHVSHILRDFM